ncbi:MAG: HEAT repeat domain-containing protein [Anaerolineae bacterium]
MTVHDLLSRTEMTLTTLAVSGTANAGPALGELTALADEVAATGLGKLAERLQAVAAAPDDHARTAAWTAAWAGVGLVRTRLLKPVTPALSDTVSLPQAPNVLFPRPAGDLDSLDGLLTALQSDRPLVRAYAAGRLIAFGDQAVPGLLTIQRHCGRCIRFLVIETLGRIGTDAALTGLVGLLGDDDVARPLEATLLALGQRSAPPVAEALQQTNVKNKKRRRAAAKILWRLGATQPLEAALGDGDGLVKAYAQAALWPAARLADRAAQKGTAGFPAAVALFEQQRLAIDALTERLDALPKNHLADAAAILWHTGAEQPLLTHYLAQITAGANKNARAQAAAFIGRLAHPAALPTLLHLVETDSFPAATNTHLVAAGLAKLADSAAVWPLIHAAQQLKQAFFHLRQPIIKALGDIGDPAAVPALLEMLDDTPFRSGRETIEQALVAIGGPAVEAIGQTLQQSIGTAPPRPLQPETAATLERTLTKIKTPAAQAALAAYRAGTDELSRLIGHLANGKADAPLIEQVVGYGAAAVEPLLALLAGNSPDGQVNAARALGQLAPNLEVEQRERIIAEFRAQLRAQQPNSLVVPGGWIYDPLAEQLVQALCDLDVNAAWSEICDALIFNGVGEIVVRRWQQTRQPWLLDIIAQGIRSINTRVQALPIAQMFPPDKEVSSRLWPPVKAIVQSETDAQVLYPAVVCLHTWGDPQAIPLLQALKKRLGSVTRSSWYKDNLIKELDAALADLGRNNSFLGRLIGRG